MKNNLRDKNYHLLQYRNHNKAQIRQEIFVVDFIFKRCDIRLLVVQYRTTLVRSTHRIPAIKAQEQASPS